MIHIEANGRAYSIEFRHVRKGAKRSGLGDKAPIRAVATCVVLGWGEQQLTIDFIAVEHAICSNADVFSRAEGRFRAFMRVLERCGRLRDVRAELLNAYVLRFDPLTREAAAARKAHLLITRRLTDAEKKAHWEGGWEKRQDRANARAGGAA
jgi:hypothetical protein